MKAEIKVPQEIPQVVHQIAQKAEAARSRVDAAHERLDRLEAQVAAHRTQALAGAGLLAVGVLVGLAL